MTIRKQELDRALEELQCFEGAQIQRIAQSSPKELSWQLRRPGETVCLSFSIESSQEYLCLLPKRPPALPQPPSFCMALRKHLMNARVVSFEAIENDRIAVVHLRRGENHYLFLAELIPHRGRWLLCDPQKTILHLYPNLRSTRTLRIGDTYEEHPKPLSEVSSTEPKPATEPGQHQPDEDRSRFPTHRELYQKYVVDAEQLRFQRMKQLAHKQKKTKLKKSLRLMQNLERDWQRCEATLERETDAELLKHNMHSIKRGDAEVVVTDYYSEGMPQRSISLDPKLSAKANLEKLFHRIKRAKRGIEVITQRMERVEQSIDELRTVLEQIDNVTTLEELMEHVQLNPEQKTRQRTQQRRLCYREYTSLDGKSIWVGRSSKDNDELTLRVAKGNDLWLHARGWAGSHVIIPLQRNESPSSETLIDAATLAAHFSQGREQTHIDVISAHVKYVRKLKGTPPGQVTVTQDKNIALRFEPERVQRLLQTMDEKN